MSTKTMPAVDGYIHYSKVLDNEGLGEMYHDYDFTDLCNVRSLIDDMDLDAEEQATVASADARLADAFDAETLQLYADYFPDLPIKEWWG